MTDIRTVIYWYWLENEGTGFYFIGTADVKPKLYRYP